MLVEIEAGKARFQQLGGVAAVGGLRVDDDDYCDGDDGRRTVGPVILSSEAAKSETSSPTCRQKPHLDLPQCLHSLRGPSAFQEKKTRRRARSWQVAGQS